MNASAETTSVGVVFPLLVSLLVSSVIGIVMIIGALKMMRLESYGWGMTASILAMLPCSPIGLLGLIAGIWSLIVLNRQNVKDAFEARRTGRIPLRPAAAIPSERQSATGWILVVVTLFLLSAIVLGKWFGPRLLVAVNNQGMVVLETESSVERAQILVEREGKQVTILDSNSRPWAVLDPGLYQLVVVSGNARTTGQIQISPSSLAVSGGRQHSVRVYLRKDDTSKAKADEELAADRAGWKLSAEGPVLSANAKLWLELKPEQVEEVNKILQASHQDLLALEAKHTERRTDESGHLQIVVKPFPAEVAKLEDQLWLKLDGVFNAEQQSVARLNLKLNPGEVLRPGMTLQDAVAPGFFGWGKAGARLELWKVGTWSHWKVSARGNEFTGSAPKLPEEYQRFWKEPEGKEAKTTGKG